MCNFFELELCCTANPTNVDPHSIKIYKVQLCCPAYLEVLRQRECQNDYNNNNGIVAGDDHSSPHLQPQPQPQAQDQQQPPPPPQCPYINRQGTCNLERIFLTRCASCVSEAYYKTSHVPPNIVYRNADQWETELHSLQLHERLLWLKFERALAEVPWNMLLQRLADDFGVMERWVLCNGAIWDASVGSGMRWIRIPTTAEADLEVEDGDGDDGYDDDDDDTCKRYWVTKASADVNWQRWWSGSFAEVMWDICDEMGEFVFPDGIWGPCDIEGYNMNGIELNFQPLTPVSRRSSVSSTISAPLTPPDGT